MDKTLNKKEGKDEVIEIVDPNKDIVDSPIPQSDAKTFEQNISPYLVFLEAMRTNKVHIEVAPTLTPKNFYEQIQFYDSGGVRRLYLYINGDWRYVTLT